MKRRNYGDFPHTSREKRHSCDNRYDDSSYKRRSSDRVHRRARSPHSPRPSRYSKCDELGRSTDLDRSHIIYKVLCIDIAHSEVSDEQVKETLYREYRKFGEFSVRISHELNGRLAFVCFRSSKDAKHAKHSKPRISIFDKLVLVIPVHESRSSTDYYKSRTRRSRSRSFSPDYDRYYHRSPISPNSVRSYPPDRFYERISYDTLPPLLPERDFQETSLPPLHPRELMEFKRPLLPHVAPIHRLPRPTYPLYGPPRHSHLMHDENDKFQNDEHHIPPEDDPLATRTLFLGNLDKSISNEDLRHIFSRFGVVEDICVKRPLFDIGNSHAFVYYQNLNMAYKAKVVLSGQYIGKLQCKISYGMCAPTKRIWVGGLGPWISAARLERKFDRFGAIKKIEFVKGDTCAYILFENIDAAIQAVKEMRGISLRGSEHKLRTDFADEVYHCDDVTANAGDLQEPIRQDDHPDGEFSSYSSSSYRKSHSEYEEEGKELGNYDNGHSFKLKSDSDIGSLRSPEKSPLHQSIDSDKELKKRVVSTKHMDSISTLNDLASKCTDIWQGSFVLKNSQYSAKCHLTSGDPNVIEFTMKDEVVKSSLRITKRLHLEDLQLKEITRLISIADMYAIFLVMPCSISNNDVLVGNKPLHNLVSYLKQKKVAGFISLVGKDAKPTGILYVFPPCEYSANLLKQSAKNLSSETLQKDHLVVLFISS